MRTLKINHQLADPTAINDLIELCPFSAITCESGVLSVDAGCRMCGLCVKNGPEGVFTWEETGVSSGTSTVHDTGVGTDSGASSGTGTDTGSATAASGVDKSAWRGIAVYAEQHGGRLHNVVGELLGKARELAVGEPVYALLVGNDVSEAADRLLALGAARVFVFDDPALAVFDMEPYANVFSDFISKVKPSTVMVGATGIGRSLAPRVAARFRTGLTADCTSLEMREGTDLIQIRPAFGGNIMARIITPNHRPQFCTVRYKIFSAPTPLKDPTGVIERITVDTALLRSNVQVLSVERKPLETDLSEAAIIVAVGRGLKSRADLALAVELAGAVGAQLACSRPLAECGWFDCKRQIGLSGRTVNADLIITLGISGSVQFAAGMKGSECIIAVNNDEKAGIFDIAHYGFVGDLYEVVPALMAYIKRRCDRSYVQ